VRTASQITTISTSHGLAVHEQSGSHHNDRSGVGLLFAQNWTICVRNSHLREGAAADPYSAIWLPGIQ